MGAKPIKQLPEGAEEFHSFSYRRADGGKPFKHYHYCVHCEGWVEGNPVVINHDGSARKTGTTWLCAFCGGEIAFFGIDIAQPTNG